MNRATPSLSLISICFLSLVGCQPPGAKELSVFPERPIEQSLFYNASSIDGVQLIAKSTLKRAIELTDIEFAMVLLESLPEGYTIETYAADLFDEWRIGESSDERGVLVLLVEDIAKVKIEVSYELEATFPDAFCKSYQETVKMYFSSKHFGDVISHSINNMVRHSLGEEVENAYSPNASRDSPIDFRDYLSGGGGITESNYLLNKEERLSRILETPKEIIEKYYASESIHESLMNFIQSLEDGVNYPYLDVLTQGSHYKRLEYPESRALLRDKAAKIFEAMPYKIHQSGDLAVVRFHQDRAGFMMFRLGPDDKWRYDLTKSWALQGYYFKEKVYINSRFVNQHPWRFAFKDDNDRPERVRFPELLPLDIDLSERLDILKSRVTETTSTVDDYIDLANLLFWDMYWIQASIEVSEEALVKYPENETLRWLAIYARYRAPLFDGIEPHYAALVEITRGARTVFKSYEHFIDHTESDRSQLQKLAKKYDYKL